VACASEGRAEPLNCAIEQVALVAQTRQRFGAISVHTTSTNSAVTLQVLTPLGLLIPAGVSIQPDDGKPVALTIQSCDNSGCHAETTVGPDLLKALQNGKRLTLSLQSLSHKTMSVDFDLKGFTAAYAKIK
jgi:invasion protein IalB